MSDPRRWYGPTVLGLLLAGGLAFVGAGRPWVRTVIGDGEGPGGSFELTGSDIAPAAGALGLVAMAAALAVLAAGGWFRRVIGVLVVLVAVAGGWSTFADPDDAVDRTVAESVAFSTGDSVVTDGTIWPWVTLTAFVLAGLLGLLVARYGAAWPTMSRRYEAPSAPVEPDPDQWGADAWKALDHGIDPTDPEATR